MEKAFNEAIAVLRELMKSGSDRIKLESAKSILANYIAWLEQFPDRDGYDDNHWPSELNN